MTQNYVCPSCGASTTRFRATLGSHICQRCGHEWAPMKVGKHGGKGFASLKSWAIGVSVVGLILLISGQPLLVLPSVVLWVVYFYKTRKENQRKIIEAYEERELRLQNSRCKNQDCENIFETNEEFCTKCGTPRARPLMNSEFLLCGSCGREFGRNIKFCPGCGTQAY